MGFKSMREELIVTKAGLGHLLEENKTVEPQYNCGCQGILFHTFYFNWGLAPICKEPENSIQWQPLETSYPQQKLDSFSSGLKQRKKIA